MEENKDKFDINKQFAIIKASSDLFGDKEKSIDPDMAKIMYDCMRQCLKESSKKFQQLKV